MFDKTEMKHEDVVSWALSEYQACSKKSVVSQFLSGIQPGMAYRRSSLSAYAIMTYFSKHSFITAENETAAQAPHKSCKICGIFPHQRIDLSFINYCRFMNGAIIAREPDVLAFYLRQHNLETIERPTNSDIKKFIKILSILANANAMDTPEIILKKISKFSRFGLNKEEWKYFIDTLGYCGILQSSTHPGFLYQYYNIITPRTTAKSEWGYPIDFWRGCDGINMDAVRYWFAEYPEIACFQP
jgi:hypothetical protein